MVVEPLNPGLPELPDTQPLEAFVAILWVRNEEDHTYWFVRAVTPGDAGRLVEAEIARRGLDVRSWYMPPIEVMLG